MNDASAKMITAGRLSDYAALTRPTRLLGYAMRLLTQPTVQDICLAQSEDTQ